MLKFYLCFFSIFCIKNLIREMVDEYSDNFEGFLVSFVTLKLVKKKDNERG